MNIVRVCLFVLIGLIGVGGFFNPSLFVTVIVGSGDDWRSTVVGMLAASTGYMMFDMQSLTDPAGRTCVHAYVLVFMFVFVCVCVCVCMYVCVCVCVCVLSNLTFSKCLFCCHYRPFFLS